MSVLAVLWLLFVCCKCETLSPHTQSQPLPGDETNPVGGTREGTEPVDGAADGLDAAGSPQPAPSPDAAGSPSSIDGKAGENLFGALTKPEEFKKIKEALSTKNQELQKSYTLLRDDLKKHTKQLTDVTKATIQLFDSLPGKIQKEMNDLQTRIQDAKPTLETMGQKIQEAAAAQGDATAKEPPQDTAAAESPEEDAAGPKDAKSPAGSLSETSTDESKKKLTEKEEFEDLLAQYRAKHGDPDNAQQLKNFAEYNTTKHAHREIEVDWSDLAEFMREKGLDVHKWENEN